MDRLDPYLTNKAIHAWSWAQVVERDDGSWVLFLSPGDVGRVLVTGGPVDPEHPRARFIKARIVLKRLIDERRKSATGRDAK